MAHDREVAPAVEVRVAAAVVAAAAGALWLARSSQETLPRVGAVAFSSDGRFLAAARRHGDLAVGRVQSFARAGLMRLDEGGINTLAFSPGAQLLAVAGRSLHVYSTSTWKEAMLAGTPGAVYGTARFSPDGRLLATVDASERIDLWDVASGKRARTLVGRRRSGGQGICLGCDRRAPSCHARLARILGLGGSYGTMRNCGMVLS